MNQHPRRMHLVVSGTGMKCSTSAKQFYAEPDQISGTCPFNGGEHGCRRCQQRTHAKHGKRHRGKVAKGDTDSHRESRFPTLTQGIGDDEQDGRPRDDQKHDGRGGKCKPDFKAHGRLPLLKREQATDFVVCRG